MTSPHNGGRIKGPWIPRPLKSDIWDTSPEAQEGPRSGEKSRRVVAWGGRFYRFGKIKVENDKGRRKGKAAQVGKPGRLGTEGPINGTFSENRISQRTTEVKPGTTRSPGVCPGFCPPPWPSGRASNRAPGSALRGELTTRNVRSHTKGAGGAAAGRDRRGPHPLVCRAPLRPGRTRDAAAPRAR